MALKAGDKCPQCKQGLLERTSTGLDCSSCDYELDIEEVIEANKSARTNVGGYEFRPKTFRITVDDPEDGEEFLRGLILAKQNNNSQYFPMLIDVVNAVLEPWRSAKLRDELAARGS